MENNHKMNITSTFFGQAGPWLGRTRKINSRNNLIFTIKMFVLIQLTYYKVQL